ncbi:MAG TPA: hypothetical protein VL688_07215 [Verrucomicrobiae bacterium]|jgi:hypothetical protein|nr:hypothetical protein [Verrucomicrobiae bacterium]
MTEHVKLGIFLLAAGALLASGPILFYLRDFFQKRRTDVGVEEFYDDAAKNSGTIFFILGGISFIGAGIFLIFYK